MPPENTTNNDETASTDKPLTLKQESFARFYIETGCASEAYRRAYNAKGMQPEAIHVEACETLKNPKVSLRVAELQAELAERHNVTADRIIVELAAIGFSNMGDYITIGTDGDAQVDLSELTPKQAAAIGEVTVDERRYGKGDDESGYTARKTRFKLLDKRGALVDLGRHLGLFKEIHEHTGKAGTPLLEPAPDRRDLARAVLAILTSAKIEGAPNEAERAHAVIGLVDETKLADAPPSASAAAQGEASGVHISGASDASSDKNDAPSEPDERTAFDNGAQVVWDSERGKWLVFDAFGTMHGMRHNRSDAETHAESLPGPGLRDGGNGDRLID